MLKLYLIFTCSFPKISPSFLSCSFNAVSVSDASRLKIGQIEDIKNDNEIGDKLYLMG